MASGSHWGKPSADLNPCWPTMEHERAQKNGVRSCPCVFLLANGYQTYVDNVCFGVRLGHLLSMMSDCILQIGVQWPRSHIFRIGVVIRRLHPLWWSIHRRYPEAPPRLFSDPIVLGEHLLRDLLTIGIAPVQEILTGCAGSSMISAQSSLEVAWMMLHPAGVRILFREIRGKALWFLPKAVSREGDLSP